MVQSGALDQLSSINASVQVVSDPELLRLALEQVLFNSLEALERPAAGDVLLTLKDHDREATITVRNSDSGAGNGDTAEWWVPFYTTKSGHLGLGLVQVLRIIEALGGRSEFVSRNPGVVELEITLPI